MVTDGVKGSFRTLSEISAGMRLLRAERAFKNLA